MRLSTFAILVGVFAFYLIGFVITVAVIVIRQHLRETRRGAK